jgi:hypothetical protein
VRAAVVAVCGLLFVASGTAAAEDTSTVTVSALRHPVDKSYRKMMSGGALFAARHALAPQASLRYKLLPRRPDTDMRGIAVSVVGDSFERPVRVAADDTFTLDPDERAIGEDASVRPNRPAGSMTWRAQVRTPGLPPDVRRLGDLRLECRVGMEAELVSRYPSLFERLVDFVLGPDAFCDGKEPAYLFFADRPLFAVTLVAGERRRTLSVGELYAGIAHGRVAAKELAYCDCAALLDRAYFVPLGDTSWPDDTRVELESMDAPLPGSRYGDLAGSSKADVLAIFGTGQRIRFDDGREVWVYDYGDAEIVVLFDAAGVVAKARLTPTS